MIFVLFRVSMRPVERIWVSLEGAVAGLGAQVDGAAAIFGAREIDRVSIVKDPAA